MSLTYIKLDHSEIDLAIRKAIVRNRGKSYNAAMTALDGIVEPLIKKGRYTFTLTIADILKANYKYMNIGEKTARNALSLLIHNVFEDTGKKHNYARSRPMRVYQIKQEFLKTGKPTNYDDLLLAVEQNGGTADVLSACRSQLEIERPETEGRNDPITTTMLMERYLKWSKFTTKRHSNAIKFGGPAAYKGVI